MASQKRMVDLDELMRILLNDPTLASSSNDVTLDYIKLKAENLWKSDASTSSPERPIGPAWKCRTCGAAEESVNQGVVDGWVTINGKGTGPNGDDEACDYCPKCFAARDSRTSSPEHRTLTGLPVEVAALKERVEKLEKTNAVLVEAETGICNRLVKLEASVKALASPLKLVVTPGGTDQFGAPKADAFFQAPDPPKPTPPPCPEGYEHLDPPQYRGPRGGDIYIGEPGMGDLGMRGVLKNPNMVDCHINNGLRWIVRPKAAPAAEPKQDFERIKAAVNALGEELQKDGRRLGVPLGGKIPGGDAYVELCYALRGETNPLRRPGGAK